MSFDSHIRALLKSLVNPSIISMLTTISPISLVLSVQRTPQLVVISVGTGIIFNSFVGERYTAALASRCLFSTLSSCKRRFKYNVNLAVYTFQMKKRLAIISVAFICPFKKSRDADCFCSLVPFCLSIFPFLFVFFSFSFFFSHSMEYSNKFWKRLIVQ